VSSISRSSSWFPDAATHNNEVPIIEASVYPQQHRAPQQMRARREKQETKRER
jgi:hypothetical protein